MFSMFFRIVGWLPPASCGGDGASNVIVAPVESADRPVIVHSSDAIGTLICSYSHMNDQIHRQQQLGMHVVPVSRRHRRPVANGGNDLSEHLRSSARRRQADGQQAARTGW